MPDSGLHFLKRHGRRWAVGETKALFCLETPHLSLAPSAVMLSQERSIGAKGMEDTLVPFLGHDPSLEGQEATCLLPCGFGKAGPRPLEPGNSTELSYLSR